ncbi:hypothetical protein C4K18_1435 [Pseudomonas chlororaphis subsp. aurantiaca]|nr:hypothetical protein C4K18_1435 [Pseudomonas chlororaphis subsp. aurantiaca]
MREAWTAMAGAIGSWLNQKGDQTDCTFLPINVNKEIT